MTLRDSLASMSSSRSGWCSDRSTRLAGCILEVAADEDCCCCFDATIARYRIRREEEG